MTVLTFQIEYHTTWGQQVCICGSIPELGQFNEANALVLSNDGNRWFTEIDITGYKDIQYYYIIRQGDGVIRREWGSPRKLHIPEDKKRFIIHDLWKNRPFHSYLYSSVFTKSIFRHNKTIVPAEYYSGSVLLNVICPYVKKDQKLCISGECEELGSWYPSKAKELDCIDNGEWQIILDADKLPRQTHYKFLIIDKNSGETVYWETKEDLKGFYELLDFSNYLEELIENKKISKGFVYSLLEIWNSSFGYGKILSNKVRREKKCYVPYLKYQLARNVRDRKVREDLDKKILKNFPWIKIPVSWVSLRAR